MKLHWPLLAFGVLAAGVLIAVEALAADPADDYRRSMGNLRPDSRTAAPAIQGSPPPRSSGSAQRVVPAPSYGYPTYHPGYSPYYPGYSYPSYGYYPNYSRYYRYPRVYYRGYLYPPPVYLPAERLYGPQAVRRFMGVAP